MGPHVCRRQKLHQRHISQQGQSAKTSHAPQKDRIVDHLISEIATSHEFAPEILSKKSVLPHFKVLTVFPFETNPKLPFG
jgi:hypothetical protein